MKCRQLVSKGGEGPVMDPYQTLARHEWSFIGNYASQWSANTFSITHDRRVVCENVISVLEECPVSAKRHQKKVQVTKMAVVLMMLSPHPSNCPGKITMRFPLD